MDVKWWHKATYHQLTIGDLNTLIENNISHEILFTTFVPDMVEEDFSNKLRLQIVYTVKINQSQFK